MSNGNMIVDISYIPYLDLKSEADQLIFMRVNSLISS